MTLEAIERVNEFTDPELLKETEVTKLDNLILEGGRAKRRGAIQSYNTDTADGNIKGLYELDGLIYGLVDVGSTRKLRKLDTTWSDVKTSLSDVPLQFQRYKDKGIFSNGSNALFTVENETAHNFIITAPDLSDVTLTLSSGSNLDASSYYSYKMTYVTADGEESAFSKSRDILTTTSTTIVLASLPTSSDTRVTGRKIYRTEGGGSTYYLVATLNNTITTYTDSLADTGLDTSEPIKYLVEVEKATVMCTHKDRLILGDITSSNSVDVLPFRLILSTTSGSLTGTFRYGMSFTMVNGRETDIIATADIALNSQGTSIFYVPSRTQDTSAVAQVNIYRTTDNVNYYLVASSSTKSRTFTDNTATLTQAFPAVSSDSYEEWINQSRIYYSDISKPQQIPQLNYIDIYSDDDESITGLVDQEDGILVFKEKSICKVYTSGSPYNWRLVKLVENIGCSDINTIQRGKNSVYFKFNDDVYRYPDMQIVSLEFKDTLAGKTIVDTAYISKYNWYVMVSTSELYIYDERVGSWLRFYGGADFYSALETVAQDFLIGSEILLRYEEDESLDYNDYDNTNTDSISCLLRSKHFLTSNPTQMFRLRKLFSSFKVGANATVTQKLINPEDSTYRLNVSSTSGWKSFKGIIDSFSGTLKQTHKLRYEIYGDVEEFSSMTIKGNLKNRDRVWS